jgi:hypothetical protein
MTSAVLDRPLDARPDPGVGVDTMPVGIPRLTLGWGVIDHASTYIRQPNGPQAGQLWVPTPRQARFWLWWYAVDEDGRWLFQHSARRLAKGSGKSPFAAAWSLEELVGPVRLKDFDATVLGGCVGKPVDMPLVQIAATAESQTANTMRMVRAMCRKGSRLQQEYGIDVGKTIFYTPEGGQLENITSSFTAAEGAETTACVGDETEHWTSSNGGMALKETLDRNLGKSGSRMMETANAPIPGSGSVIEMTWEEFKAEQDGTVLGEDRTLFDALIAPPTPELDDEAALDAALAFVYEDCPWVNQRDVKGRIYRPRAKADVSRRYYLNQATSSELRWVRPAQMLPLVREDVRVEAGERIAMFFDGSKTRDATALVGCRMSDGHVFVIGSWEPPDNRHDQAAAERWQVPVSSVEAMVEHARNYYRVVAFLADVREWESQTKTTWPALFEGELEVMAVAGGKSPQWVAWDMRSHALEFALECELTRAEIVDQAFTYSGRLDGDDVITRHAVNAVGTLYQGRTSIAKESPDSPKKIDAAVCMVGARMARRLALAAKPKEQHDGRVWG